MPGNIGPMEIILVLVIALLVLGPKKLPEVGRSIGKGIREFREGVSGIKEEYTIDTRASSTTPAEPADKPAETATKGS